MRSRRRRDRDQGAGQGPEPERRARDALLHRVRAKGLKQTEGRRRILAALWRAQGHLSVEDLLLEMARGNGRVPSAATVYRTLRRLAGCGLLNERRFTDDVTRFELADKAHHDHLICTGCGAVLEFTSDEIERLQGQVAREHGFEIHAHKMELYGRCWRCRSQ